MIKCNLSVILAEKNLKITRVSNDTGISRTTLTSLAYDYSKGIQFDTLNALCMYLKVAPEQLISFIPIDITITNASKEDDELVTIYFTISEKGKTYECSFVGHIDTYFDDGYLSDLTISIELWDEDINNDDEIKKENYIIVNAFQKLSSSFFSKIESDVIDAVLSEFFDVAEDVSVQVYWDDELTPAN